MSAGTNEVFQPTIRASRESLTNAQFGRILPLFMAAPEFAESLRTISELANLPDNWDSYGSPRLKSSAVQRAVEVLVAARSSYAPAPRIAAVSGGGLQIEWEMGARELEIEVLPDGSIEILMVEGEMMIESPAPAEQVNSIVPTFLHWLSAGNLNATSNR
jgi:hypothetical protein